MEQEQAIKYLKELRKIYGFNSDMCTLENLSPAMSLRIEADKMEYREKLLKEIDEFLLTR